MKIAILGASGFIGKNIYDVIKSEYLKVVTLGRSSNCDIFLDLNDFSSIVNALETCKPNILIHAASPSVQNIYRKSNQLNTDWAEKSLQSEIIGSSILFNTAASLGVEKIIYLSSAAIYGENDDKSPFIEHLHINPNTLYGAIKLSVEQIGKTIFPNFISLRLFQVYGFGDIKTRLIPTILNSKNNSEINLSPCTQISDLIYVNDVANCILQLIKSNITNGIFNLGSGQPVILKDVVNLILKIKNKNIIPIFGANNYNGNEVMYSCANMSKLYSQLNWRPNYTLEKGVNDLLSQIK